MLCVLNLSHRDSHEFPEPLTPGKVYDVTVETEVAVTSDRGHFHVSGWIKARDGDKEFATRQFKEKIKCDCM